MRHVNNNNAMVGVIKAPALRPDGTARADAEHLAVPRG